MTKRKILAISSIAAALVAAGCSSSSTTKTATTVGAATTAAAPATTAAGAATTAAGAATTAAPATAAAKPAAVKRADMLTLGTIAKITDYSSASGEYGNRVDSYQAVYDSLLYAKPDGTVVPNLATEWKFSPDNLTITLKLRTDVTFTDGTKFDAAAAAANLNRYKAGKAPSASNLTLMDKATAIDPATLEIKMKESDPAILAYLARDSALMESPAYFGNAKEKTVPVGTGPYILDEAKTVPDSTYVYHANPKYWAPERIKYENLTIKIIEDPAAALNAIKAGEVNAMNLINNDALKEVTGAGFTLVPRELDWAGLTLVDKDGAMGSPLKNLKVRQAINMAFDRKGLLASFGAGHGTETTQVFRKASPGFDPALDSIYPYDVAKAKALLAEAGFAAGFELKIPKVAILGEAVWVLIADQMKAVGINVTFTDVPPQNYFPDILTPKYPAFLMFLEQSSNDWQAINFQLAKTAIWNPSHYGDATSDGLVAKIKDTTGAEQAALVKQLGKYVTEQAWFAPWYRIEANFAIDKKNKVEQQAGNAVPYLFSFSPA
jgi:peptide/nickel transport system substrate-binding protein